MKNRDKYKDILEEVNKPKGSLCNFLRKYILKLDYCKDSIKGERKDYVSCDDCYKRYVEWLDEESEAA